MAVLKASDADAFAVKPDPRRHVVLIFGPDAGAVGERAEAIVRASVDDANDPFSVVRLDGDEVAADPPRLIDEALTVPLFGGRRAIWVKAGGRNIAPAVEPLFGAALTDCRVVIEAGDLKKSAPLRAACEKSAAAVAIPCYADGDRDIGRLIDDEMRQHGLAIARDAREALIPLLGGDRRATRSELRKLATYAAGGSGTVERADVIAVIADAAALALDDVVDSAFAGRARDLDHHLGRALAAGTAAGTIMFATQRQLATLHKARLAVETGSNVTRETEAMRPHFSRREAVESALKLWTAARLERAMQHVATAQHDTRVKPALAETVTRRALQDIAVAARRAD